MDESLIVYYLQQRWIISFVILILPAATRFNWNNMIILPS